MFGLTSLLPAVRSGDVRSAPCDPGSSPCRPGPGICAPRQRRWRLERSASARTFQSAISLIGNLQFGFQKCDPALDVVGDISRSAGGAHAGHVRWLPIIFSIICIIGIIPPWDGPHMAPWHFS